MSQLRSFMQFPSVIWHVKEHQCFLSNSKNLPNGLDECNQCRLFFFSLSLFSNFYFILLTRGFDLSRSAIEFYALFCYVLNSQCSLMSPPTNLFWYLCCPCVPQVLMTFAGFPACPVCRQTLPKNWAMPSLVWATALKLTSWQPTKRSKPDWTLQTWTRFKC